MWTRWEAALEQMVAGLAEARVLDQAREAYLETDRKAMQTGRPN